MSVPNTPAATISTNTPTFNTTWEDIERVYVSSTPMITEREVTRSVLFTSSADSDTDMGAPSPISDIELSQIINIEGAAWADEFANITYDSRSVSPPHLPQLGAIPSASSQPPGPSIFGLPAIYHKLCGAGAPFWAAVSIDIQHCLCVKMSQKLSGREPTKTQFLEVYAEALSRQARFPSTWQAVRVTLDVPRIANLEAPRDTMVENALQTKALLHVVEAEVITTPTNAKFTLALMLTFTAAWVRYRSRCHEKAALIVLPRTTHPYHPGLLPQPQDFTAAFRSKLKHLLDDHSKGWGLLHEHPPISDLPNPSTQVAQFVWFGNLTLKEAVHRALYDPAHPGWFGFLEDVRMSDGHRFWAPLQIASPRQVGQVLGWIEELLNFHVTQANKARGPFAAYAQVPDNFTAHDSVIKKAGRHTKFLSFLCGGTGEVLESDDPFGRIVDNPEELQGCLQGYRDFVERPAHLPYDACIAEYH